MSEEPYPCELCSSATEDSDSAYCDACNTQTNLDYSVEYMLDTIERHVRMFGVDRKALLEGIIKGAPNETPTT